MIANDTTAVILAAGLGTRMKSKRPKVLHELAGRPMVLHLVATLRSLGVERIVGVVGEGMEALAEALSPYPCVVQRDRLGTAHAVLAARERLEGLSGTLLALYGDTPLIPAETVRAMMNARNGPADPGVVVLGFRPENPGDYGRLATDETGALRRIVEAGDASASELEIGLCNSGVMAIDAARAPSWLAEVDNDNAGGEYYLTDLVAIARSHGRRPVVVEGAAEDLIGINSRVELAEAEGVLQNRLRRRAMENGATLRDPASVHFSFDTVIGADVLVEPHVVFGPGVTVESGSRIRAYSYLENCRVGADVAVGPFARLRPGTRSRERPRQFRRDQKRGRRTGGEGQSPRAISATPASERGPISAPGPSPAITTASASIRPISAPAPSSDPTRPWWRRLPWATARSSAPARLSPKTWTRPPWPWLAGGR